MGNSELFKGKTVVDFGSGLGIRLLPNREVQSKDPKKWAEEVFWDNQPEDIIERKIGKIEDIEIDDKIDIIVSEWMGCCLM